MAALHPHDHGLLTPPEVLGYLRVTARTLYRLMRGGQLPAVRVGRQWRVSRTALDEWLRHQQPAPPWDQCLSAARSAGSGRHQPRVPPGTDGGSINGAER
ncbi:MAG: helix-turn-helix domain-containing protein [Acidobacteriota bacterium]